MNIPVEFKKQGRLLIHILFWIFGFGLLTYIYGTAYDSFSLGVVAILILLPVHICYYYLITKLVLPRFFRGEYLRAVILTLSFMFGMAILYRVVEIFIANPYIFNYYKTRDPSFTWKRISGSWWSQLLHKGDFVNAIERSNVIVWIGVTLKLFALWHERKNVVLQAELNALKGQLHPHFLFNSLNNLYALSLNNAPQTPEVILGLSNILRYVIYECAADRVSLSRDVEVLQDYISLEKLRYEERLELNLNVDTDLDRWDIAPLLLLPLVENAFKHGAGETIDNPWINIELKVQNDRLIFKISNSKPDPGYKGFERPRARIGLSNVKHRLTLLYSNEHTLDCYDEEDFFIVELTVKLYAVNKMKYEIQNADS